MTADSLRMKMFARNLLFFFRPVIPLLENLRHVYRDKHKNDGDDQRIDELGLYRVFLHRKEGFDKSLNGFIPSKAGHETETGNDIAERLFPHGMLEFGALVLDDHYFFVEFFHQCQHVNDYESEKPFFQGYCGILNLLLNVFSN